MLKFLINKSIINIVRIIKKYYESVYFLSKSIILHSYVRKEHLHMEKREKSIEKRLSVSIFKVSMIIAAGALIGLIALISISNRYSYALRNFGFAQGDIGKEIGRAHV